MTPLWKGSRVCIYDTDTFMEVCSFMQKVASEPFGIIHCSSRSAKMPVRFISMSSRHLPLLSNLKSLYDHCIRSRSYSFTYRERESERERERESETASERESERASARESERERERIIQCIRSRSYSLSYRERERERAREREREREREIKRERESERQREGGSIPSHRA